MSKSDGLCTMINGDSANILQCLMQVFLVIDELKNHFKMQKALKFGKLLKKRDLTKAVTKCFVDAFRPKFENHSKLSYNTIDISSIVHGLRVDPIHYKDIIMGKMFKYFTDKIHDEMKPINYT